MAYGLKCFDGSGYITFDTTLMSSYLRLSASGTVSLSAGATSSAISATGVDYIYVWPGAVSTSSFSNNIADTYEIVDKTANSFKIKNLKSSTNSFNYLAFTR